MLEGTRIQPSASVAASNDRAGRLQVGACDGMLEHGVQSIEVAMSTLAFGLNTWAEELQLLDDFIETRMNIELARLRYFTDLRQACDQGEPVVLGSTITLVRKATRETFCIAAGVTTAPVLAEASTGLLSWQYGFWCNAADYSASFISPVYALPADAGDVFVLEELAPAADAELVSFIEGSSVTDQAFVSYVRENAGEVDRLCGDLGRHGVATWKDRDKLEPGVRWKDAIRAAIQDGSAFVACFSSAFHSKPRTYMNEELAIAIEELRLRPRERSWFFPVLLDDVEIPATPIGPGETLRDLQAVSLGLDWSSGISRLARAIRTAREPRAGGGLRPGPHLAGDE